MSIILYHKNYNIINHVIKHFTNLTIFNYRQCYKANYSNFCTKQTNDIVIY